MDANTGSLAATASVRAEQSGNLHVAKMTAEMAPEFLLARVEK